MQQVWERMELLDLTREFESLEQVKEYVYSHAIRNGFVALTSSTTKDKRHCIIACNRRGSCKSKSKGLRNRGSHKCGCKWHVNIWAKRDVKTYYISSGELNHNHHPLSTEELERHFSRRKKHNRDHPFSVRDVLRNQGHNNNSNNNNNNNNNTEELKKAFSSLMELAPKLQGAVYNDLVQQIHISLRSASRSIQSHVGHEPNKISTSLDKNQRKKPTKKLQKGTSDLLLTSQGNHQDAEVKSRSRKCGVCQIGGHDSRTCPSKTTNNTNTNTTNTTTTNTINPINPINPVNATNPQNIQLDIFQ